jgi:hypothetical protein
MTTNTGLRREPSVITPFVGRLSNKQVFTAHLRRVARRRDQ